MSVLLMHAAVYIMWLCGIFTLLGVCIWCNVLYSQKGECPPSKPPAVKSPGSHGNSPHEHAAGQPPPPVYIPC